MLRWCAPIFRIFEFNIWHQRKLVILWRRTNLLKIGTPIPGSCDLRLWRFLRSKEKMVKNMSPKIH